MKKTFLVLIILFLFFTLKAWAYYDQLTEPQIAEALRLGQLYRGNLEVLFNNLFFEGPAENGASRLSLQVFTPFSQLVLLAALSPNNNLDPQIIEEIAKKPKIFLLVYPELKQFQPEGQLSEGYLEITGEFFSQYLYGSSGISDKLGKTIYNKILEAGLNPKQFYLFPAKNFSRDAQINFCLPKNKKDVSSVSIDLDKLE